MLETDRHTTTKSVSIELQALYSCLVCVLLLACSR